ncbi:HNH endonuclease [Brachybacterium alimentarium]|uniref:HNH endonuclease n=1 Tax=Brachybacterium alimentarium TaxID=47845 RepID=UPI003FD068BF
MAASRTGTTRWKGLRAKVIRQAQRDGVDRCPECAILLDYTPAINARNSPEVDHIIPWSRGGKDTLSNCRVICQHCNRSLGAKTPKRSRHSNRQQSSPSRPHAEGDEHRPSTGDTKAQVTAPRRHPQCHPSPRHDFAPFTPYAISARAKS